ncbi:Uncharacterized protein BP5553_09873 [Venustampulla echinocandica]|uniref:Uncharacterized protein n=1 Tax=Venustampulla echinocandica TaxID=2656787 RepID=A0A370TAX7_9HELO|nr:Uncharacterized protein BP5553_09873 [Venustampulla echinocandica]RDL31084.1 Uncharacterized protein BP5553_09873 [Venustampulla echinocandica]
MAARPGEELVATLFVDAHYYYSPPTSKPLHHRFDKSSYLYLFENATLRRARIEIANNAGTPEQDAFTGHLDGAHVHYSHKHSNLVTLTVDGHSRQAISGPPPDSQEWHLPTFDPRNEKKYMYKLHTVDVYFWLKEDAHQFLNGVRRVLPPQQITIQDEPVAPPPHQHDMSPVVQKLENMAITHSPYHQGQIGSSQPAPAPISQSSTSTFPGPPISATPQSQEASNFAPLAYNPAAPAAPESIMHREKTPPPQDGAANPLAAAAASDQGQTYGISFQNPGGFAAPPTQATQQQHGYFPGPPAPTAPPSQFNQPPPSAGMQSPYAQHFQHSFAAPPTAPASSSPFSQPPPAAPGPPPYQHQPQASAPHIPVTQQYATQPLSPGLSSSGVPSPGIYSPLQTPGTYAPAAPSPPSAPPGGFATFNYAPQQQLNRAHTQPLMTDYSIHQQAYRPTAEEAAAYGNEKKPKPPGGKLEAHGAQVEKGVSGLLRKLEKKLG